MVSLSDLQLIYQFLNYEWNLLIYGERDESWRDRFLSWLRYFELYIWETMGYTTPNARGYYALAVILVMGLGVIFAIQKTRNERKSLDTGERKNDDAINREQENKTQDEETGSTLTAVVKPTFRPTSEPSKLVDSTNTTTVQDPKKATADDLSQTSDVTTLTERTATSISSLENLIDLSGTDEDGRKIGPIPGPSGLHFPKRPLVQCSSSLYVLTSHDSVSADCRLQDTISKDMVNNEQDDNEEVKIAVVHDRVEPKVTMTPSEKPSPNVENLRASSKFDETTCCTPCQDKSSVSEVSPSPEPIRPQRHSRNSSYALGHFGHQLPELDLTPISDKPLTPKKISSEDPSNILESKKISIAESQSAGCPDYKLCHRPEELQAMGQGAQSASPLILEDNSYRIALRSNISRHSPRTEREAMVIAEDERANETTSPSTTVDTSSDQRKLERVQEESYELMNPGKWPGKPCRTSTVNVTSTPELGSRIPLPLKSHQRIIFDSPTSPEMSSTFRTCSSEIPLCDLSSRSNSRYEDFSLLDCPAMQRHSTPQTFSIRRAEGRASGRFLESHIPRRSFVQTPSLQRAGFRSSKSNKSADSNLIHPSSSVVMNSSCPPFSGYCTKVEEEFRRKRTDKFTKTREQETHEESPRAKGDSN